MPLPLPSWLVRAPAWADLLPGALRFFARLVAFDIACPGCGEVYHCGTYQDVAERHWDRRVSRFRCPACKGEWTLGIVAWEYRRPHQVPRDALPDREQYERLTRGAGHLLPQKRAKEQGANVLVKSEDV